MLIFDNKQSLKSHLKSILSTNLTVGFVPTMGALHAGHLSLLQNSVANNKVTVISIFVNPTQFNNPEDLEKYPRDLETDIKKIKTVSRRIIVFAPAIEDIYGSKTFQEDYEFDGLDQTMEGKHRPGHFKGVATVVRLLFETVNPNNAYFGEKDFQQLMIIKKMVQKLNLPVKIHGCEILREKNGLAMSSRNERLTKQERQDASEIYSALKEVKRMYNDHVSPMQKINDWIIKKMESKEHFNLEYFEIAEESTLLKCNRKTRHKKIRAFIAV